MTFPEWFNSKFGPHTEELYRDEVRQTGPQVEALARLLGSASGRPVLDLCCGWGRHALPLMERGYPVVGLDGCEYFLNKLCSNKKSETNAPVMRGDMRKLPFAGGVFQAVYQMYTSFGYGEDPEDDHRVLSEVTRVLNPGGLYLLDQINWSLARRAFDGVYEEHHRSFDVIDKCSIEPGDLLRIDRALLFRDGRRPHIYSFEIRMFDLERLKALVEQAGLVLTEVWGDFDRSSYDPGRSYRMILICRKREG